MHSFNLFILYDDDDDDDEYEDEDEDLQLASYKRSQLHRDSE